jgi:putative tryptophan/tyrosine transport system substrate-binding protein
MRRRNFIAGFASATATWPLVTRAQQPTMPVIGFLSSASREIDDVRRLPPFRQGLKETGFIEGQNVAIEYRGADDRIDRLPALATDLVRRRVSLHRGSRQPSLRIGGKIGDGNNSYCS